MTAPLVCHFANSDLLIMIMSYIKYSGQACASLHPVLWGIEG